MNRPWRTLRDAEDYLDQREARLRYRIGRARWAEWRRRYRCRLAWIAAGCFLAALAVLAFLTRG